MQRHVSASIGHHQIVEPKVRRIIGTFFGGGTRSLMRILYKHYTVIILLFTQHNGDDTPLDVLHILNWICSLIYPAWNVHAPYCHLWPVRLYYIFPHYLKKRHDFRGKKNPEHMCFDFLYNFCLNHFSLQEEFIEILSQMYRGIYVQYIYSSMPGVA
jgi:hypothetical protein